MNTLVLDSETAKLSLEYLLKQLGTDGIEVRDEQGNIVAVVLVPGDKEALTYAEASIYLDQHKDEMRQAIERRGGITTSQLLEKAALAAKESARQ